MFTLRLLTPLPLQLSEGQSLLVRFGYTGTGSFTWTHGLSLTGQTATLSDVINASGSGSAAASGSPFSGEIEALVTAKSDSSLEGTETIGLRLTLTGDAQFEGGGQEQVFSVGILDVAPPISGTDLANALPGTAGDDTILGLGGNDWITPGAGNDSIDGGIGTDMLSLVDRPVGAIIDMAAGTAVMGTETDRFTGIENVTGTIHGDTITGDAGANLLRGLGHYDWFLGSGGGDTFDGGQGRDMVSYATATAGVTVNLATGHGSRGQATGDTYVGIERVTGSSQGDTLIGGFGEEDLRGLGGDDILFGSTGGRERFDGGAGWDTVSYALSRAGVEASLLLGRGSAGDAARDLYTAVEHLTGSRFDDVLTGNHGINRLEGGDGHDLLSGNAGDDRLYGGTGNDTVFGGTGNDTLEGDAGDDLLYGGGGVDSTWLFTDEIFGGAGNDTAYGAGTKDFLQGGYGDDTLYGEGGDDRLWDHAGNNTIYGGAGDDDLDSGTGNSTLYGGDGNDHLSANTGFWETPGNVTFHGGAGDDRFWADPSADFGHAVALYDGNRADYTLSSYVDPDDPQEREQWRITGIDGTDVFYGIDELRFADGFLML